MFFFKQLPPLHQKRILAFVNHFLISSCSFLNDFSLQCETKFIALERKLQKVEASLTILEAKVSHLEPLYVDIINSFLSSLPLYQMQETGKPSKHSKTRRKQRHRRNKTAKKTRLKTLMKFQKLKHRQQMVFQRMNTVCTKSSLKCYRLEYPYERCN